MTTFNIGELAELTGASTDDVDNWIRRLRLSTNYTATGSGKARAFTRDNALELAFLSHLVSLGMAPAAAAEKAGMLVQEVRLQERDGLASAVFIFQDEDRAIVVHRDVERELGRHLESGRSVIAIPLHKFIDRVDQVLAEKGA